MLLSKLLPEQWKERLRRRAGAVTISGRLTNLRRAGFTPRKLIDAGAYRGEWTRMALRIFPDVSCLLIEPQPQLAQGLREMCSRNPKLHFQASLLGAQTGNARFLLEETNSRILPDDFPVGPNDRFCTVPVQTLASVARAEDFEDCDLIKLDLQGHELAALAGAGQLFGRAQVIITEVSWLRIGDVPLFHEVCVAMAERGYRAYDIFGFNYRPLDGALWQTDVCFVREDSPLIASRSWN